MKITKRQDGVLRFDRHITFAVSGGFLKGVVLYHLVTFGAPIPATRAGVMEQLDSYLHLHGVRNPWECIDAPNGAAVIEAGERIRRLFPGLYPEAEASL